MRGLLAGLALVSCVVAACDVALPSRPDRVARDGDEQDGDEQDGDEQDGDEQDGGEGDGGGGDGGEGEGEGEGDGGEGEGEGEGDGGEGEGEGDGGEGDGGEGEGEGDAGCVDGDVVQSLDEAAARFTAEVFPLFARAQGGCLACHGADSGRLLRIVDDGRESFFRLRAAGFLRDVPGSALDRIASGSMPQGGPAWTSDEQATLKQFMCALSSLDGTGEPVDEEFPPGLTSPYTGPPSTIYDNTFLTYDQLRARVIARFDDEWVRQGVDKFSENIALFGGVDFFHTFIPARDVTPEFLTGLDLLGEDVCARAVADGTGPFDGEDLDAPVFDEPLSSTTQQQAEFAFAERIVNGSGNVPFGCVPAGRAIVVGGESNAGLVDEARQLALTTPSGVLTLDAARFAPAMRPAPRTGAAMVWNDRTGRLFLFGGDTSPRAAGGLLDDSWEYVVPQQANAATSQRWEPVSSSTQPSPRAGHAMAFDALRGLVVLFGGTADDGVQGDTWVNDDGGWREVAGAGPPPRTGATLTYQVATRTAVLFGGFDADGVALDDTWTFDGARWLQVQPLEQPPARGEAMAFYDVRRKDVVVFGGARASGAGAAVLGDTWTWNGTTWTQVSSTTAPPARRAGTLSLHASGQRGVLLGGADASGVLLSDQWLYDGGNAAVPWAPATLSAATTSSPPPGVRGAAAAYYAGDVPFGGGAPPSTATLCTASGVRSLVPLPRGGAVRVTARARGDEAGPELPRLDVIVDGDVRASFFVPELATTTPQTLAPCGTAGTTCAIGAANLPSATGNGVNDREYTAEIAGLAPGDHIVDVVFGNDFSANGADRNMFLDRLDLTAPLPGSVVDAAPGAGDALRARLSRVMQAILQRPVLEDGSARDEVEPLRALFERFAALEQTVPAAHASAYGAVCEALLRHPDFLYARPPSADTGTPDELARGLVVKSAFDLVDRPPTDDELLRFDAGESRAVLVEEWLSSDGFRRTYEHRVRQILESDGTPDGDEPARLWTYIAVNDRPLGEVLTAEYTVVDDNGVLAPVARPAVHGPTGVLTMKGYIVGKPGLPHYNYAARVLTGFMGMVFDVPQAAFDARATATATSTVDPTSLCYSCHQLLTPLAHQRLAWDDDGNFRTTFDDGRTIDDSDHDLVADYPFRGPGLASFSLRAVRKEGFLRRMANVHALMLFARLLRHETDERALYADLFAAADHGNGTFKEQLRLLMFSPSYEHPVVVGAQP